jgi:threonine aldolase
LRFQPADAVAVRNNGPMSGSLPVPPDQNFASDNTATVHPAVMDALVRANVGHQIAYGDDPFTETTAAHFRDLFGAPVESLLVWGGTGANVVGLASLLQASQAVICSDVAHISVDEGGAPERFAGAKLIDLATTDGKLVPAQIEDALHGLGDHHHVQPHVVSLTQSTELGTLYTVEEVAAIAELAHRHGLYVHMDGARIANAAAALGDLRSFTIDVGVDVLSFGGTKNGMMYGEAVVFLDPTLAKQSRFIRKQATQLPSKARYIAAQFNALFTDDLWLANARHANAMAQRLYNATRELDGVDFDHPPAVNGLFPRLRADVIDSLQAWTPFYTWDASIQQVRWMTSFDTTTEDVDRFAAGVAAALA